MTIDDRFSDPSAVAPTWDEAAALLDAAELYWLTTVRADGRPHTTPLVGVWHDDALAFCTGAGEQKHVNLRSSPLVSVTTGVNTWAAGTDVVVEGAARRVLGHERLAPLAAAWQEKYGADWAWAVTADGFDDGEGSRPEVFEVRPAKVIVFGKDPHAQTTFRFTTGARGGTDRP